MFRRLWQHAGIFWIRNDPRWMLDIAGFCWQYSRKTKTSFFACYRYCFKHGMSVWVS